MSSRSNSQSSDRHTDNPILWWLLNERWDAMSSELRYWFVFNDKVWPRVTVRS